MEAQETENSSPKQDICTSSSAVHGALRMKEAGSLYKSKKIGPTAIVWLPALGSHKTGPASSRKGVLIGPYPLLLNS